MLRAIQFQYLETQGLAEDFGGDKPVVVCSLGDASITEGEVAEAFEDSVDALEDLIKVMGKAAKQAERLASALERAAAAKVGQLGKPEAYYFPPQANNHGGDFPYTFFGFNPGTTKVMSSRSGL